MASVRGVIAGVAGLALAQAIVSNKDATANTNSIIGFVSRGLARWLDPYTALIPDLRPPMSADELPGFFALLGLKAALPGISVLPGI